MTFKKFCLTAVIATALASPVAAEGDAQEIKPVEQIGGKQIGRLNCTVEGGFGLLLGSSKKAACVFKRNDGTVENYNGKLNKLGLDIGVTEEAYMTWAVFTREDVEVAANDLAGRYSGVSGELSLGIGLGANALIGGNSKQIGLQPIAVQGANGLNLAVGLATLKLDSASQ